MKTIEEKNCMIAEFMGCKIMYQPFGKEFIEISDTELCGLNDLKYHYSWDWLMPVVEQIDHIEYESERLDIIDNAIKTRVIGDVHKAVCEFIEWYNENK